MLDEEIKLFDEKLPEFLKGKEGAFVLIKRQEISFYDTEKEAIAAGFKKYRATGKGFLVRKVLKEQPKIRFPSITNIKQTSQKLAVPN